MDRKAFLRNITLGAASLSLPGVGIGRSINHNKFNVTDGPFKPNWDSLSNYQVPEWYKNAKFGIWAHWGAQCEPENGDWYARHMYAQGHEQYEEHLNQYGHPSKVGFKDVIRQWKAENWDPEGVMKLFKKAGAQFFMAMANHHDNFDNYDSKYQPWNSVNLGPKQDIIGGWAKAAKKESLRFGVSVHASHAWRWYETSQMSDTSGSLKGVPYDGNLTKADGKGEWWEGYDPQDLYAQNHPLSEDSRDLGSIHRQWAWGNGAILPDKAYCEKFFNRTIDLIEKYEPDVLYFDDTVLPFYPFSDIGLEIASHFYNINIERHGKLEAVLNGKILDEQQRKCMVWDIEKGQSNQIEPYAWQTDTCIGSWHYDRSIYDNNRYKSAKTVIQSLVDIVSKNGNMLLSIPMRGDGTIDSYEKEILEDISRWMDVNSECIFGTRPWKVFGEGPAQDAAEPISAQGFNEGQEFTTEDIRFTQKGNDVYAIVLEWPSDNQVVIESLGTQVEHAFNIQNVKLLGRGNLNFEQLRNNLVVHLPDRQSDIRYAAGLKLSQV